MGQTMTRERRRAAAADDDDNSRRRRLRRRRQQPPRARSNNNGHRARDPKALARLWVAPWRVDDRGEVAEGAADEVVERGALELGAREQRLVLREQRGRHAALQRRARQPLAAARRVDAHERRDRALADARLHQRRDALGRDHVSTRKTKVRRRNQPRGTDHTVPNNGGAGGGSAAVRLAGAVKR